MHSLYPKGTKPLYWRDIYTPMFIAALFTIAKTWKQPKCPSMDEWIKKMWHIYNEILLGHKKKERNPAICNNIDGPWGHYDKWISQT